MLWLQVWRVLFWAMAALATMTCILVGFLGVEPRRYLPKKDETLLPGLASMSQCYASFT
jgi:hypothetical protein